MKDRPSTRVESEEELVSRALAGDREALEQLVHEVTDKVFGLSLRMLYHPQDAEDATQEILVKVVTHLSSFRSESTFSTWVYRIAANHLIHAGKLRKSLAEVSFEALSEHAVVEATEAVVGDEGEARLWKKEVRLACLQAMLLCLDKRQRLAFILGVVCELPGDEAASAMEMTPTAYRKLLSRARTRMVAHLRKECSEFQSGRRCVCEWQIAKGIEENWIRPDSLRFSNLTRTDEEPSQEEQHQAFRELSELRRISMLFQREAQFQAPGRLAERFRGLIRNRDFGLLEQSS